MVECLWVCSSACDGIGWIRSHFYFLAQHWWRLSRASSVRMLQEVCQVAEHTPNPIFTVSTDSLHHTQRCIIRLWKGRGAQEEEEADITGDMTENQQFSCVSVTIFWNQKWGIRLLLQITMSFLLSVVTLFPLISLFVLACQLLCQMCTRSHMKANHTSPVAVCFYAQIYWFHDPHPSPHTACSLSVYLSHSFSPPFPLLSPKIQSCVC